MKKYILGMTVLVGVGVVLGAGCRSQNPTKLTSIPGLTPIVNNPTPTSPVGPVNPAGPGPGTSLPGGPTGPTVTPTGPANPPIVVNPSPNPPPGPNQEFANFNNTRPNYEFFRGQTVYFDYDSAALRPGDMVNIEFVARHLLSQPNHLLYVEGHCDERGTEQYNLSLGERRAQAVRDQLMAFGISSDRVQTISYGEKQPVVEGAGETSYQANRRGEFVLMTQ